jgi:dienelactone hydrolase
VRGTRVVVVVALLLAVLFGTPNFHTHAQSMTDRLRSEAAALPDLKFSGEGKKLRVFSSLDNAVFRPDGAGPFPAIVLHHTCGGIGEHSRYWTDEFLKRGYVVLVIDSLGPRGVKEVCGGPGAARVTGARGVKDAFDAMAHLQKIGFVDAKRIGYVGKSWGGAMGLLVSSKAFAEALSPGARFGAVVSLYPGCWIPPSANRPSGFDLIRNDVDRPLLVLMGEADNESPPSECIPRLQALKDRGAPVEWHLYPGATHAWDRRDLHNVRRTDWRGSSILYLYSKETTEDSGRRIADFMERQLGNWPHCFTAPAARPALSFVWSGRNRSSGGSVVSAAAAITWPHSVVCSPKNA